MRVWNVATKTKSVRACRDNAVGALWNPRLVDPAGTANEKSPSYPSWDATRQNVTRSRHLSTTEYRFYLSLKLCRISRNFQAFGSSSQCFMGKFVDCTDFYFASVSRWLLSNVNTSPNFPQLKARVFPGRFLWKFMVCRNFWFVNISKQVSSEGWVLSNVNVLSSFVEVRWFGNSRIVLRENLWCSEIFIWL